MNKMKKLLALALVTALLLPAIALADWYCGKCGVQNSWNYCQKCGEPRPANNDVYAIANQRLATRSGPGTQYTDMGTYYVAGQSLHVICKAWDSRNNIYWVLVDIPGAGQLWTGAQRFDNLDLNQLSDGTGGGTDPWDWLIGKMGMIYVNEGVARRGAGTNYYEIGPVFYGEWYEILEVARGNTEKDWCKINYNGQYAWISTGLLLIDGIDGGTINGVWAP